MISEVIQEVKIILKTIVSLPLSIPIMLLVTFVPIKYRISDWSFQCLFKIIDWTEK